MKTLSWSSARSQWMKQKRKVRLEIPLLFTETTKLWIQCFSDLGTKGFQISFLTVVCLIVTQTTQASPQEEITDWIIYWPPWWRQKCRPPQKKKSNLLISRKIWKKNYIALLYSGYALWYRWIVLNFQSLVKILSAKFSVTINGKTYYVTMEQIFKIYKDAFTIDTKYMYVTFISFIFKSET